MEFFVTIKAFPFGSLKYFLNKLILIPDQSPITLRSLIGDKSSEANDNFVFDANTHVRTAKDRGRGITDLLD